MENLKNAIEETIQNGFRSEELKQKIDEDLQSILKNLYQFYLDLNPHAGPETDPVVVVEKLNDEVKGLIEKINLTNEDEDKVSFYAVEITIKFVRSWFFLGEKFGRSRR